MVRYMALWSMITTRYNRVQAPPRRRALYVCIDFAAVQIINNMINDYMSKQDDQINIEGHITETLKLPLLLLLWRNEYVQRNITNYNWCFYWFYI